jgi:uncharacterized membrane protein YbhN (UPF0104 family)
MPFSLTFDPRLRRIIGVLFSLVIVIVAFATLHSYAHEVTWDSFLAALTTMPAWRIEIALLFTVTSFCALAGYEVAAARMIVPGVPVLTAIFAGAAGNAISNTLGFHVLTGGALRYRLYARVGVDFADVGRITGLSLMALGLGYIATIAIALWFQPMPFLYAPIMTLAVLALLYYKRKPRQINIAGWTLYFFDAKTTAIVMIVGAIEMAAAGGTLYVLLPSHALLDFSTFMLFYIGAIWLGVISHAPGGLGVFEATLITALPAVDRTGILASLLVYRAIYNILPFMVACSVLLISEFQRKSV